MQRGYELVSMHACISVSFSFSVVTVTCVMATIIHGTYRLLRSRLYVSHIRSQLFSDIYRADSMVGHIRSWPDTHEYFKDMWNYMHYKVNCSLYKKKKRHRCMHKYKFIHMLHTLLICVKYLFVEIRIENIYYQQRFLTPDTNRKYIL